VTPSSGGKGKGPKGGPAKAASATSAGRGVPVVQRVTEQVDTNRFNYRVAFGGVGLLVSIYLTILHFTAGHGLFCPEGALINCNAVLTSPEAEILGIPVAFFGFVFFLVYLGSVFARRRLSSPRQSQLALVWVLGGAVVVMYLLFAELFLVHFICLWCSFIHLMVLSLFVLEMWPTSATDDARADARRRARQGPTRPVPARAGRH
jgi:uncharacterized membrane protein